MSEKELMKKMDDLGKEIKEALGKLPPLSRHKSTVGAWRRIDKANIMIDDVIKQISPGGSKHGIAKHSHIVKWLQEIRKTLVG